MNTLKQTNIKGLKLKNSFIRSATWEVMADEGGNRNLKLMEKMYNESNIALFGISRPLVSEANLIDIWSKDSDYPPKCISCNRCFSTQDKQCILHK